MESNANVLRNLSVADNDNSKMDCFYSASSNIVPSNNNNDRENETNRHFEAALKHMDGMIIGSYKILFRLFMRQIRREYKSSHFG